MISAVPSWRKRLVPLALLACALVRPPREARAAADVIGPYTVVHSGSAGKAAAYVLREAPRVIGALEEDFGPAGREPLTIVLLEEERGGEPAPPADLPSWAAGAAFPGGDTVYLKLSSAVRRGPADIRRALAHELTHLYLRRRTHGRPLPRWLEEGVAMHRAGEYEMDHRLSLSFAALRGGLMPLASLERFFPADEAGARLAYAAGYSFTDRLMRRGGIPSIRAMLDAVGRGEPFPRAFAGIYGRGLPEMEEDWRRSLTGRSRWIAGIAGGSAIWGFMALLFLGVYWMKRLKAGRLLETMEEEEDGPGGEGGSSGSGERPPAGWTH